MDHSTVLPAKTLLAQRFAWYVEESILMIRWNEFHTISSDKRVIIADAVERIL
jgi:hypothetical protein